MTALPVSRRARLSRRLPLPGWSARSCWGWDPSLECFWARLVPTTPGGRTIEVSPDHLVPTLTSLARALAVPAGLDPAAVYVVLTGGAVEGVPPVTLAREAARPHPA